MHHVECMGFCLVVWFKSFSFLKKLENIFMSRVEKKRERKNPNPLSFFPAQQPTHPPFLFPAAGPQLLLPAQQPLPTIPLSLLSRAG
jgi:hypothetical protein